ncbi:MAG TPA: NADH-ubiquinone oxidoreductase-F iron-sulfur binding region domain-containing protein [Mycobacteriales bacterium]|jgi:NADH:ubiquinone oxidoreductase subunit F (NADH-binding)|nr:NADH-ubiquinone oxidoreductase-F iron-sulfur binding region domain-containing protein [Mycobacteriales bacterium]
MNATRVKAAPVWERRLLATVDDGPDLAVHQQHWGPLPSARAPELLSAVQASGLLGRGGAGFPTARKMLTVAAARGRTVVVANGAEGEPASAKDRLLLMRAPHLVLDGIQLAAKIVHADEAYLVLHGGTGTTEQVYAAMHQRRDRVGVELRELPAAYVASEESALVHWLSGGEAKPTFTPPRPFERGVNGRPTLVNNVETLAHLATIVRRGGEWFREAGDADEPGTLLVTVSGRGVDRRVAEVPTGIRIGDVLERAGVDVAGSQAVLVGGYFGTWLPADLAAQLPLSHHALRAAGGALGAGILVALPRDSCGVAETARVAAYLAAHNAGQCGPCLNGLPSLAGALNALATGRWDERWWPALERWMAVVPGRGACRHPDGAVRFIASGLSVFAADVAEHRAGRPCASVSSPALLRVPAVPPAWR